jgi:CrcB protein
VRAIARYVLALWIQQRTASLFLFGTFIVNISGCLVMGVTMTLLTENLAVSTSWRFLVPVRFIGAYTTFSTFEFDTFCAIEMGEWMIALMYLLTSVIIGFAALWFGIGDPRGRRLRRGASHAHDAVRSAEHEPAHESGVRRNRRTRGRPAAQDLRDGAQISVVDREEKIRG